MSGLAAVRLVVIVFVVVVITILLYMKSYMAQVNIAKCITNGVVVANSCTSIFNWK